eukprot:3098387-Pleurochrysis_carterae.AAC.2
MHVASAACFKAAYTAHKAFMVLTVKAAVDRVLQAVPKLARTALIRVLKCPLQLPFGKEK